MEYDRPNDVRGLQRLLGMINYYHRFVPRLAQKLAPLYDLLRTATPRKKGCATSSAKLQWTPEAVTSFEVFSSQRYAS